MDALSVSFAALPAEVQVALRKNKLGPDNIRTVAQLNALLRKASAMLGLRTSRTAHSARAGWATELQMAGVPFPILKERGRWRSDESLRIYLDTINALHITENEDVSALRNWVGQFDGEFFIAFWTDGAH